MSKEQFIVGLDIGTFSVRVVQAKIDQNGIIHALGAGQVLSSGMRKGVIVDVEEVVSCISSALEKVERMTGIPVTYANVSIGGSHIDSIDSKGVIAVSRADGEISEADIVRVVDASQAISLAPNREILHVLPKGFSLDGQSGITDPVGMTGIRLEVETMMVSAGLPYVKNLQKALQQASVEADELVFSPLASAQALLTKRQKELGVVLVDLGAGTTSFVVYEENVPLTCGSLPIGGMHITNDLAIGLRLSIETAERMKVEFGNALSEHVDRRQDIDVSRFGSSESFKVGTHQVAEIIEARLEEIFEGVAKHLKKIGREGKLPAGVVLTGGGAKLPGVQEFAKRALKLPVSIGEVQNMNTIIELVNDPSFSTACGLVLWGSKFSGEKSGGFRLNNPLSKAGDWFNFVSIAKIKDWIKSFLP